MNDPTSPTSDRAQPEESTPERSQPEEESTFDKWLVRFFLILVFGVAFGIEGMTLFRSYVLDRDAGDDAEEAVTQVPALPQLGVGDEVLPATAPSETVQQLSVTAQRGADWTFELAVRVQNPTDRPYTLTMFGLLTQEGAVREDPFTVTCAPGETVDLNAAWTLDAGDRPKSIVASGRTAVTADSVAVEARRVRFERVPVQMAR